jgi:PAS domain-containing protein
MSTPIFRPACKPKDDEVSESNAAGPRPIKQVNLSENCASTQQQEVLDALPVLVFLERGGKVVFANAEARHTLGLGDGEWE